MIKYHPSDDILAQFASGQLPVSVSVAVSIHVEMCTCCQAKVAQFNAKAAEVGFEHEQASLADDEFDAMFELITNDESLEAIPVRKPSALALGDKQIILPSALAQLSLSDWNGIGKIKRKRVKLEDGSARSSLLHIEAGGEVPAHTHTGQELTILLDGSFEDEMGTYHRGDFIWLDKAHQHQPVSEQGCLCYTVVTDPLHFVEGFSRLLNPIGKLIY